MIGSSMDASSSHAKWSLRRGRNVAVVPDNERKHPSSAPFSDDVPDDVSDVDVVEPYPAIEDLPLEVLELVLSKLRDSAVRGRTSKKTGKPHRMSAEDVRCLIAVSGVSRRWRDAARRAVYRHPWQLNVAGAFSYTHPNQLFVKSPGAFRLRCRSGLC